MMTIIIMLWIFIGILVVLYGIQKKKQYGYISPSTIGNFIIILVSVIIWPLSIINIINFVRREEQIIKKVIMDNQKYTRDTIIKGAKIWRDMRKRK